APAVYQFNYQQQTVQRGAPNLDPGRYGPVSVPLLTSVLQPDGSSWTPGAAGYLACGGSPCSGSESLISLTLPTLGRIDWTYQQYAFPTGASDRTRLSRNTGIQTRKTSDAFGSLI